MVTFLLIVLAVVVVLALVGVVGQIFGGGPFAVMHVCFGSVGTLVELLGALLVAILDGFRSN